MKSSANFLETDRLAPRQGKVPNLYRDKSDTIDLNFWEPSLQRLASARTALDAEINRQLLRPVFSPAHPAIPHSPATDRLVSLMSTDERLSHLSRLTDFYTAKHSSPVEALSDVLATCMMSVAGADNLVVKYLRGPANVNPTEVDSIAADLEQALINLREVQ